MIILYSFYKNMAFSLTQFLFAWYNGFSGQTMYDSWYLAIYNVTSTGLPIMGLAVFDLVLDLIYAYVEAPCDPVSSKEYFAEHFIKHEQFYFGCVTKLTELFKLAIEHEVDAEVAQKGLLALGLISEGLTIIGQGMT